MHAATSSGRIIKWPREIKKGIGEWALLGSDETKAEEIKQLTFCHRFRPSAIRNFIHEIWRAWPERDGTNDGWIYGWIGAAGIDRMRRRKEKCQAAAAAARWRGEGAGSKHRRRQIPLASSTRTCARVQMPACHCLCRACLLLLPHYTSCLSMRRPRRDSPSSGQHMPNLVISNVL